MISQIFVIVMTFIFVNVVGVRIANSWKKRDSAQERYESELKALHDKMLAASDRLSKFAGERLYLSQRLVLINDLTSPTFAQTKKELNDCVVAWNKNLMQVELEIRTLFSNSRLVDFESLQAKLAGLTEEISTLPKSDIISIRKLKGNLYRLRGEYFTFIQGMIDEAAIVSRQMHFGVVLPLNEGLLEKFTTWELIKNLFLGGEEPAAIVRPPSDLGAPVFIDDARFGIHQERGYGSGLI